MHIDLSSVFLLPTDLQALTRAFPEVDVDTTTPLEARFGEGRKIEFEGARFGVKDAAFLEKIVRDFGSTKLAPSWLTQAQIAFSEAIFILLRHHVDLSMWDAWRSLALEDPTFLEKVSTPSSRTGELGSQMLVVLENGQDARSVIGRVEVQPNYFSVRLLSDANAKDRLAKLEADIHAFVSSPLNVWKAEFEFSEGVKTFTDGSISLLYGLLGESTFLFRVIEDLNNPTMVTADVTRNVLVRSLAGTEPEATFDMLAAVGLQTLPVPPFRDISRVERLKRAAWITGEQLEKNLDELKALSEKPTMLGKFGSLLGKKSTSNPEIGSYWPARDYQRLCIAIGLRR